MRLKVEKTVERYRRAPRQLACGDRMPNTLATPLGERSVPCGTSRQQACLGGNGKSPMATAGCQDAWRLSRPRDQSSSGKRTKAFPRRTLRVVSYYPFIPVCSCGEMNGHITCRMHSAPGRHACLCFDRRTGKSCDIGV